MEVPTTNSPSFRILYKPMLAGELNKIFVWFFELIPMALEQVGESHQFWKTERVKSSWLGIKILNCLQLKVLKKHEGERTRYW
jgi:hypothetical protein